MTVLHIMLGVGFGRRFFTRFSDLHEHRRHFSSGDWMRKFPPSGIQKHSSERFPKLSPKLHSISGKCLNTHSQHPSASPQQTWMGGRGGGCSHLSNRPENLSLSMLPYQVRVDNFGPPRTPVDFLSPNFPSTLVYTG